MDKRRNYFIVLDTETANGIIRGDKLDLSDSLVYDLGFAVVDKYGTVYKTYSFVIKEIFFGEKEMMDSAYYADKRNIYLQDIKEGSRQVVSFYQARKILLDTMREYNTNIVCAHNARFDLNALNNTQRWLTSSRYRYFFKYGTVIWDSLKMSRDIFKNLKGYKKFCLDNGYMTRHKTPQIRLTAEIIYRYITGNNNFIESHTGLEDVLIENEIVKHCFRQHKKMRKELFAVA